MVEPSLVTTIWRITISRHQAPGGNTCCNLGSVAMACGMFFTNKSLGTCRWKLTPSHKNNQIIKPNFAAEKKNPMRVFGFRYAKTTCNCKTTFFACFAQTTCLVQQWFSIFNKTSWPRDRTWLLLDHAYGISKQTHIPDPHHGFNMCCSLEPTDHARISTMLQKALF